MRTPSSQAENHPSVDSIAEKEPRPTPDIAEFEAMRAELKEARETLAAMRSDRADIRDLKSAPQALSDSEEMHRVFFELSAVGILYVKPNGRIYRANETFCQMVGYTADELAAMTVFEITPPDHSSQNRAIFDSYLYGEQETYASEKRFRREDGTDRWVTIAARMIREPSGKPKFSIAVIEDITERKSAQENLRTSQKELETAVALMQQSELRLNRLHQIISDPSHTDPERLSRLLRLGVDEFGLETGVVAEISGGIYRVALAESPDGSALVGSACDAREVICTETLRRNDLLALGNLAQSNWRTHRAYRELGIETYFGVPLPVSGRIFGTLCYTSRAKRPHEFSTGDHEFLRLLAQTMGAALTRLETDRTLKASEEFNRTVLENSPDCVKVLDAEGRLQFMNQNGLCALEIDDFSAFRGRPWWTLWPETQHVQVRAAVESARRGEVAHFVALAPTAKSNPRWWDVIVAPVVPAAGAGGITSLISVSRDVTAEKKTEAELHRLSIELRERETRLRLATEATGVGVWEWDLQSNRLIWDAQMFAVFGITPTADHCVDFLDWRNAVMPADLPASDAAIEEMLNKSGKCRREYRIIRQDNGQCRHLLSIATLKKNTSGRNESVLGSVLDVTAQKKSEQGLKEAKLAADAAQASAESANNAKDHFLAVLSHELRTPLNPALMAATILEKSPLLPADLREDVEMIRRNVELEARLIDDLLDLTRISRGKLTLARRMIDGNEVLRHAVETCQADAVDKSQSLVVHYTVAPVPISADPARLQQVFWNLLKNAIKFTPEMGRINVIASMTQDGGFQVEVVDSGKGISAEALPHIFKAFEQGEENVNKRYGGLGLGLAICNGLVHMHGGAISAASEGVGRGSTFIVVLPPALETPIATQPKSEQPTPSATPAETQHILLVEDHANSARVTARLLRSIGYKVTLADCVQSAIDKFDADPLNPVDLVLSDLGLPDGSGESLLGQLLARRPVKAIALSGYGMESDIQQTSQAGFLAHLTKPVNASQLEEVIARVLRTGAF